MDYFSDQAKDLIEIRKAGHLPAIEPEIPKCQKNKKILNNRPQGNHGF